MDIYSDAEQHNEQSLQTYGTALEDARVIIILLHGRGATSKEILFLADLIDIHDVTYLAPQAPGKSWYPNKFTATLASNEPWLSSALGRINSLLDHIISLGIPPEKVVLGGFSQGACLVGEYAVRNPQRYGGIFILSGGLIGPPGTQWKGNASLNDTPIFIGCSDRDEHIPLERVYETAEVLARMGGKVETKIFPNLAHTVHPDEINAIRKMLTA